MAMPIAGPKASFGLFAQGTISRPWESGTPVIGLTTTDVPLNLANIPFSAELFLQDSGDEGTLDLEDFTTTTDADSAVAATLTTALSGSNNDLVFTAATGGATGNDITVAYSSPVATGYTTTSTATDTAILITLGAKARMDVTGFTGGGAGSNLTYSYASVVSSKPSYTNGTRKIEWSGTAWEISNTTGPVLYASSSEDVATPDLVVTWTPSGGVGTPVVAAGVSSASQVAAAVTADDDSSELVSAANAAANDGTGAVTVMVATNLSGGVDANGWSGAALDFNSEPFGINDAIHGFLVYCETGKVKVQGTYLLMHLPQGGYGQMAVNPSIALVPADGLTELLNVITFTAELDNTRVLIAALTKS